MSKPMIPVSDAHVAELEAHLKGSGKGLFESPAAFINLYNSGIMNKSNEEVKDTANHIVAAYKNVREQGGVFIFLSEAEVALDEVKAALEPWYIVSALKRVVQDFVEDGALQESDQIAFNTKKDVGNVLKVEHSSDDEGQEVLNLIKLDKEKLFTRGDQVESVFAKNGSGVLKEYYEEENVIVFTVEEVQNLDDSFALSIRDLI